QQISNEVLQVQQGSLYPELHRLEQQGWIRAKWAERDSGRQAKFYSLTAAGRTQLDREKESWSRLSSAINLVVEGAWSKKELPMRWLEQFRMATLMLFRG